MKVHLIWPYLWYFMWCTSSTTYKNCKTTKRHHSWRKKWDCIYPWIILSRLLLHFNLFMTFTLMIMWSWTKGSGGQVLISIWIVMIVYICGKRALHQKTLLFHAAKWLLADILFAMIATMYVHSAVSKIALQILADFQFDIKM